MILLALISSCSSNREKKYRIGVSQCSDDIWRDKQNSELKIGAYFHDNVELRFAVAYDSDERQIQQIDSLVGIGFDLLIVAPNQVSTISSAIDRAYDKGIPVIVFERKTSTKKYTAYMGADNYEMGHLMGEYVASRLNEKGKIIEVMGLKGSSPAIERHNGFSDAIAGHPGIQVVATLQGDWTEPTAYKTVKQWLDKNYNGVDRIDLVFGMNDRTAMGARKAFEEAGAALPLFCGIDGLPGENGGIRLVQDSLLDASYIYPTHGDQLLQLAVDILEGKPYEKETKLMSALVTDENARVLLMESEEIMRQSRNLEQLHERANQYLDQLGNQRTLTFVALAAIFLLLALLAGIYMYYLQRARIQDERMEMEREQLDFYTQVSHELRTPLTLIEGPLAQLAETPDLRQASQETCNLFSIVRRNTHNLTQLINKLLDAQVGGTVTDDNAHVEAQNIALTSPAAADSKPDEDASTVLIVDDNADIRAYLRTILQDRYRLLEAQDGKCGLELAKEQVPDLIVSDVMMPVMNGLEFCQQVKADVISSHIPVILLTARALDRHLIEGYQSGADAYITKPFSQELLLARIENLLHSRHQLHDLWSSRPVEAENKPEETAPNDTRENQIENAFIARFKKVVEEQMGNSNISVEDLAAKMGLSRVQLYRKVKALTGNTPVDLLRKARLAQAQKLLQGSSLSVSEIAYQVGFASPSYFSKCYKDEFGIVPGEERKQ